MRSRSVLEGAAIVAALLAFVIALLRDCLSLGAAVSATLQQNSTLESVLKDTGFLLNYIGLIIKGELHLRLLSLFATGCCYGTLWAKWPKLNWVQIVLQSGLLLRAGSVTWRVLVTSLEQFSFTKRELELYSAHFEAHGLSKREFHALLSSGAEWHRTQPGAVLQYEGEPADTLWMLYAGSCTVSSGGALVAMLGPGALVGESAFARRHADERAQTVDTPRASATVAAVGYVEYLAWPVARLEQEVQRSSHVKACLMTMVAVALAEKLVHANKTISAENALVMQRHSAPAICERTGPACTADLLGG